MSAARTRSLKQRHTLICQAAYEVESLGALLQRSFGQSDSEDMWVRGVGARLRALASVAMNCTAKDCGGEPEAMEAVVYGPAWVRKAEQ